MAKFGGRPHCQGAPEESLSPVGVQGPPWPPEAFYLAALVGGPPPGGFFSFGVGRRRDPRGGGYRCYTLPLQSTKNWGKPAASMTFPRNFLSFRKPLLLPLILNQKMIRSTQSKSRNHAKTHDYPLIHSDRFILLLFFN